MSLFPISPAKTTIYFGYGSNLWRHQMSQRCPTSKFLGIARLEGYKWIIYERGYANIVEIPSSSLESPAATNQTTHDYAHEVWGLVYALEPSDEVRLDVNEGVPKAYQKEEIACEFWKASHGKSVDVLNEKAEKVDMLVYINRKQTKESKSKEEYVYRMNMGIKDAVKEGVPTKYVEQVLRKFIPDVEDERVGEVAKRQALEFEDES